MRTFLIEAILAVGVTALSDSYAVKRSSGSINGVSCASFLSTFDTIIHSGSHDISNTEVNTLQTARILADKFAGAGGNATQFVAGIARTCPSATKYADPSVASVLFKSLLDDDEYTGLGSRSTIPDSKLTSSVLERRANYNGQNYNGQPPTAAQAAQIVTNLKSWNTAKLDTSSAAAQSLMSTARGYLSVQAGNQILNQCIFYAGPDAGSGAATQANINGKITVGLAYYGYGAWPFDPCLEPFSSITAAGLETAWFQVTSAAFASVCAGTVYFISDSQNWQTTTGRTGGPSIFVTHEMPALQASGNVQKVYQICESESELWNQHTSLLVWAIKNNIDVCDQASWQDMPVGDLPGYLIWSKS